MTLHKLSIMHATVLVSINKCTKFEVRSFTDSDDDCLQWVAFFPKNCLYPRRDLHPIYYMVHCIHPSHIPNGILLARFSRFAGLTNVTNRPADYATPCVAIGLLITSTFVKRNYVFYRYASSSNQKSFSAWQTSTMKFGCLLAENSRRLRRRLRSLWQRVPFLFCGRQAFEYQQISGAVCWPRTRPARSRRSGTLAPIH